MGRIWSRRGGLHLGVIAPLALGAACRTGRGGDGPPGVRSVTVPAPVATAVTHWSTDPFAMGGYSYLAVGSARADRVELARPVGRLFFAGEATSTDHPATWRGSQPPSSSPLRGSMWSCSTLGTEPEAAPQRVRPRSGLSGIPGGRKPHPYPDPMAIATYADVVERWLQRLANEGRSTRTLDAYRADLDDTMTIVASELGLLPPPRRLQAMDPTERDNAVLTAFDELDLRLVTLDHLDGALAEYRTRPDPRFSKRPEHAPTERSPASVARRVAALRGLFGYAVDTDRLAVDPTRKLKAPKQGRRLPRNLASSTAESVLDAAADDGGRWPERDVLIVSLGLACGLRLSEMAGLRMDAITPSAQRPERMRVVGKGNKERELAVPPLVAEALGDYLPTRAAALARLDLDAETVLISTRPRPVRDRAERTVGHTVDNPVRAVSYAVDRILRQAGAKRQGVRVHALRHTFASVGLHEGILNLRELQAALGHASLATTERYTHVGDDAVAAGMRAHPLGQRRRDT